MISEEKIGCLFIVPTIMSRPKLEISNVEHLAKSFPNDRVLFISNVEDEDFLNYKPTCPNIEMYVSNKLFSIARALNYGLEKLQDEKYICFVQSDIKFSRIVIEHCKQISDHKPFNTGIVGTTKHSNFHRFHKLIGCDDAGRSFYTTLWADGIMFWSREVAEKVGIFNEEYFGDKESQEYCYRAHDLGYNNIYFEFEMDIFNVNGVMYENEQVVFKDKIPNKKYNVQEFLAIKNDTVQRFRDKWIPWEEQQHHRFK